jgi:hypothetical protein
LAGECNLLKTGHAFGAELLRLCPRSGHEYAFSGDAPRYVRCILFIFLGAFALLSVFLADCLQLITADLWVDWLANAKVLSFFLLCMLAGFALSAGVLSWIFHAWLNRHTLVVYEHGLRGQFPDLEFAVPFEEVIEVWVCRHPDCQDDDVCEARKTRSSRSGDSTSALRWIETIVSWYLTGLAWIFGLILALAGGSPPEPPKKQAVAKVFLAVRGGVVYPLGRYLRRFREADRGLLIEILQPRLAESVWTHEA